MSTNPKDAIGLTKPALRLVPPALLLHVAGAMADGAEKYGPYNWRKNAVRLTVYIEAAQRHLLALLDGEDLARDSKRHHAAHVAASMGIILDALETGHLIDDRADGGCAADIIDRMTPSPAPAAPVPFERKTSGRYEVDFEVSYSPRFKMSKKAVGDMLDAVFAPPAGEAKPMVFECIADDLDEDDTPDTQPCPSTDPMIEDDPFPVDEPTYSAVTFSQGKATPLDVTADAVIARWDEEPPSSEPDSDGYCGAV